MAQRDDKPGRFAWRLVLAGAILAAAGAGAYVGALACARQEAAPAWSYGLVFVAPPADVAPAEGDEGPGKGAAGDEDAGEADAAATSLDLAPLYRSLGPADAAAVGEAMGKWAAGPALPLRAMKAILYGPPRLMLGRRAARFVLVSDADADRWLAPLAGPGAGAVDAYVGLNAPLADLLATGEFPAEAAGAKAARLPPSATMLAGLVVVRERAAARFGWEAEPVEPNLLAVPLGRGSLEAAVRGPRPLVNARGLRPMGVDQGLAPWGAARLLGVAALVLMVAGGAAAAGALVVRLGEVREAGRSALGRVAARVRIVSDHRRAFAVVLGALVGAVALGAACGGSAEAVSVFRERYASPLARINLGGAGLGVSDLATFFFVTALVTVVLRLTVGVAMPSLIPGVGVAAAVAQGVAWGMMLAPDTLVLLERVPYRAAVASVEAAAYAMAALGAWRVVVGLARPRTVGGGARWQGYAIGADQMYRLLAPAAGVLAVAAVVETLLVAAIAHLG